MKAYFNFLTFLSLPFLIAAAIVYANGAALRNRAELTAGKVTGMSVSTQRDSDNNTYNSYCPQIEFTTRDGREITYFPDVCSTSPEYENGQQVEIYYDPEQPEHAQVKGFWQQHGITVLLAGIGLPFLAVGVFMGWLSGRKPE